MQPKQFKIKPDGFREIRKKYFLLYVPGLILSAVAGLAIVHLGLVEQPSDPGALYTTVPVVLLILTFSLYKGMRRQKEFMESFSLAIGEDAIIREQKHTPVLSIRHSEVKEIIRYRDGSIHIKTAFLRDSLLIPAQIAHRAELEAALGQFQPIKQKASDGMQLLLCGTLALLEIALMVWVFLSESKVVVTIGGSVLAATLTLCTCIVWKSKNVDRRTRKGMLWVGVVLFAIIGRMVLVLLGK